MKLWTIQHAAVTENLSGRHNADWQRTSPNFRAAYRWMMHHMHGHTGSESTPVWCWHSCDGQWGRGPSVETAHALLGDWDLHAHENRVMELEVPEDMPLLSSYGQWNELLDEAITSQETPTLAGRRLAMFDEPLFKREDDDIQAVLPYIEQEWIVDIRPLPATCNEPDRPI